MREQVLVYMQIQRYSLSLRVHFFYRVFPLSISSIYQVTRLFHSHLAHRACSIVLAGGLMTEASEKTNTSVSDDRVPTPRNATMLQAFEWYTSAGGKHLKNLAGVLDDLSSMGITAMWVPRKGLIGILYGRLILR